MWRLLLLLLGIVCLCVKKANHRTYHCVYGVCMCLRFSSALLPRFAQKHVQHPSRVSAKVSVLYYNPFDFHRTHTHRLHKRPRPSRLYTTAVAACTSTHISNAINERMNAGTHCNFCHAFFLSFFHYCCCTVRNFSRGKHDAQPSMCNEMMRPATIFFSFCS